MAVVTPSWNMVSLHCSSSLREGLVEPLIQTALQDLAQTYEVDVAVWAGLDAPPDENRLYILGRSWRLLEEPLELEPDSVQCLALPDYPDWVADWEDSASLCQLSMGDLLIPILCPDLTDPQEEPVVSLVFQLHRKGVSEPDTALLLADITRTAEITGWSDQELQNLEGFSRNLAVAFYQAMLQERLGWVRQQAGMIGRIAHLLNSSLSPDTVLRQILAEVGQEYGCDRCFILDLRQSEGVSLTAHWEADTTSAPFPDLTTLPPSLWTSLLEQFLQDGVSYRVLRADEADSDQMLCEFLKRDTVFLVPIFLKTDFFGLLVLALDRPHLPYRVETLQTLYQVTDHIAIALHEILSPSLETGGAERRGDRPHQPSEWWDPLTHLPDRDALEQELDRLSHRTLWPTQADFSVLLVDIDYFKLINDTHGNQAGDEVLQGLAQRLKHQLRQGTLVYRYGGEEFLIVLNRTTLNPAADVAERLRATVQRDPLKTSAGPVPVTVSFGVAQRDRTRDTNAYSVVERAHQALLEAKRQGRNRIKVL